MKKLALAFVVGLVATSCSVTSPVTATNNEIGSKVGKSETTCVFGYGGISSGIVLNKNYGIAEAAKNGNINTIATVDLKIQNFIIVRKHTLIVTGK
ncbi:TRL domain-containing protein [Crocinitomix algicola]|uniref:TRL domain-containing protein n=1 Tax=Crocinitomix algicola TaxID=1740263 RepID=UPI00082E7BC5|nr:TRL domain-containing protein [Crocinitomix algicola]